MAYGSNSLSGLAFGEGQRNSYGPSVASQMGASLYDEAPVARVHEEKPSEPNIDYLGPLKYLQARKNQWLKGVL